MLLHILSLVLLHGGDDRGGDVVDTDLAACLATNSLRSRYPLQCAVTVSVGFNSFDIELGSTSTTSAEDAWARDKLPAALAAAGDGAEATRMRAAREAVQSAWGLLPDPEKQRYERDARAAGPPESWRVDGRPGDRSGRAGSSFRWTEHRVSPLSQGAHTLEVAWCDNEAAAAGQPPTCTVELQLRVKQCVYIDDLEGEDQVWLLGPDISLPVLWIAPTEPDSEFRDALAEEVLPQPGRTAVTIWASDVDAVGNYRARTTAFGALGRERQAQYKEQAKAERTAAATALAAYERTIAREDGRTSLTAGHSPTSSATAWVPAGKLIEKCLGAGTFFDHFASSGKSRPKSFKAVMLEGTTHLRLCTKWPDGAVASGLNAISGLFYSSVTVKCEPETWVRLDTARVRLKGSRGACGDYTDSPGPGAVDWWAGSEGCMTTGFLGCFLEQQRLALASCTPGTDCVRARSVTATCMTPRCTDTLLGYSAKAHRTALAYANEPAERNYARAGSVPVVPDDEADTDATDTWKDADPRGACGGLGVVEVVKRTLDKYRPDGKTLNSDAKEYLIQSKFIPACRASPHEVMWNVVYPKLGSVVYQWAMSPKQVCHAYWLETAGSGATFSESYCNWLAGNLTNFQLQRKEECYCQSCHTAMCDAEEFAKDFCTR